MQDSNEFLSKLTKEQEKAAQIKDGPLLVLAGAGTGKTRTIVSRIFYLIKKHDVAPHNILTVTFTNEAVRTIKERVSSLLGEYNTTVRISTFHAEALNILREFHQYINLPRWFSIIDDRDQEGIIKQIIKDRYPENVTLNPKYINYIIQRLKDYNVTAENFNSDSISKIKSISNVTCSTKVIKDIYQEYTQRCLKSEVIDFGDILIYACKLFSQNTEILTILQNKYKYILVDEFQDTNHIQFLWLQLLVNQHHNLCAVGDDDQSIYGWRGAEISNILNFGEHFPNATIIKLECNYRSTKNILNTATALVANNNSRMDKTLYSPIEDAGNKVNLRIYRDSYEESDSTASIINMFNKGGWNDKTVALSYRDIAILVRAGYQTLNFENSLTKLAIPYRIVGGISFYERKEIKDILAYLKVIFNHKDDISLLRIINTPRRGIGTVTLDKIMYFAQQNSLSVFEAIKHMIANDSFSKIIENKLSAFIHCLEKIKNESENLSNHQIIKAIVSTFEYEKMLKDIDANTSDEKIDNINELLKDSSQYADIYIFLEHTSLVSQSNQSNRDEMDMVNIMTLHAAKGLEFETVFLPCWEEGSFPNQKAILENNLEEERRLAYVGITRAKNNLFISYAKIRSFAKHSSAINHKEPSRFIEELPKDNLLILDRSRNYDHKKSFKDKKYSFQRAPPKKQSQYANLNPSKPIKSTKTLVRHKKFGQGKVLKHTSDSYTVEFDSGTKEIIKDFLEFITV